MTVTTVVQETLVDAVNNVVITPIIQDPVSMLWLRQIQVYSPPDASGNPVLQFTLELSSATEANIELVAPAALF